MSKFLRVLFFKPILGIGGETKWLFQICSELSRRGHEPSIIFLSCSKKIRDFIKFYPEHKLFKIRSIKFPLGNPVPLDIYALKRIINEYDVLYAHFAPPNDFLLSLVNNKSIVPKIIGFHSFIIFRKFSHRNYLNIFIKHEIKNFNCSHVLNKNTELFLKKMGVKNINLIPNGVNTKLFNLCNHPSNSECFNVLYAGRLEKEKGILILNQIVNHLNDELKSKINFLIAGTGSLENVIKSLAKKNKNIKYLGLIDHNYIASIYQNAHAFLLPSKTEGMPISGLEAQSCGLPVIGSNIPGISDIVINNKTGKLISPENAKEFAAAIKNYYMLWKNFPEKYFEMNKTIRKHIVNNYDWNIIMEKIEKMFKECSKNLK